MSSRRDAAFAALAREVAAASRDPLLRKAEKLLKRTFPQQLALIQDPAQRKAVLVGRGGGKSYALAIYLLWVCLTRPRARCIFLAITREKAKEILWLVLKELDEDFELGFKFNEAEIAATAPNGARIRLRGCENSGDVDKLRGEPFDLVILDESASWTRSLLEELFEEAIEPRLRDHSGTLVMAGTPGDVLAGPFYEATGQGCTEIVEHENGERRARSRPHVDADLGVWRDVIVQWSLHTWHGADNTAVPHNPRCNCEDRTVPHMWGEALWLKKQKGWSDDHPKWTREYLGRWMADDTRLVWRYLPERDDWERGPISAANPFGLPEGHAWRYVLGGDLGFKDPFVLQVGAFSDTHPNLFHVYEKEATGQSVGGIAEIVQPVLDLLDADDIEAAVLDIDANGGVIQAELANEYGIFFEKAEKKEKRENIEIGNGDLIEGRSKILKGSRLADEMLYLSWDDTGLKEKASQRNNNSDAWLYLVRRSRHREARPPVPKVKRGTPQWEAEREAEAEERAAEKLKKQHREFGRERQVDDAWGESSSDWFSDG